MLSSAGAVRSVEGRQLWRSWDWDQQAVEETTERLQALVNSFDEYDV